MNQPEEEKQVIKSETTEYSAPTGEKPSTRKRLLRLVSWREHRGWLIIAALFVALAILIILISAGRKKAEEESAEAAVVSVRVATAERGEISSEVTALGTIFPREAATVSAKINAQIKQMPLVKNK